MSGKRDWKFTKESSPLNEPISDDNSDLDFGDFQVVDEVNEAESKFETKRNEYKSNDKKRSEKIPSSSNNYKNDKEKKDQKNKFVEKKDSLVENNPRESKKKDAVFSSRHTALGVASYLQHLKENPVKNEPKIEEPVINVQEKHKKSPNRMVHKKSGSPVSFKEHLSRFTGKSHNFKQFGNPVIDRNPIRQSRDTFVPERSPSVSPVRVVRYGSPDEPRYSRGPESRYQHHSPPRVNNPSHNFKNIQVENFASEQGYPNRNFSEKYKERNFGNSQRHISQERPRSPMRGNVQRNMLRESPNRIPFQNRSPSSHENFDRGSPYRPVNQVRPELSHERHHIANNLERCSPSRGRSPQRRMNNERIERFSPPINRSPHRKMSTERFEINKALRSNSPFSQRNMERDERYSPSRRSPHRSIRQMSMDNFEKFSPHGGRSPNRGRNPSRHKDKERLTRDGPFVMQNPNRHLSQERVERFSPPRNRSPSHSNKNITGRYSPARSGSFKRQSSNEKFGQFGAYRSGSPKRRIGRDSPPRGRSPPRKPGRRMRNSEERDYMRNERSSSRSLSRDREERKSPFEHSSKKFKSTSRRSRSESQERNMGIDETSQQALRDMKKIHNRECQRYRDTPSGHPDYNVEYRKFCENKTRKVIELGGDPTCYDFITEWNTYWPKRMSELFKESWLRMKEHSLRLMSEKRKQAAMANKTQAYSSTPRNERESSPNIEKKNKHDASHLKGKLKPRRESSDIEDSASKVPKHSSSITPTEEQKRCDNDDLGLEEIGDSILDEIGESFTLKSKSKKAEKSSENVVSSTTSSEDVNDNIIDLIKIFCKMDDKLGSLGQPIKELYIKGIELQANGVGFKRLLEDSDNKMLLQLVSSKLASLSKFDTSTSVQRIVFQESKERLDKILQKTDSDKVLRPDSMYKEELDISCIARATLGKETGEIVTFIKNELKYLGYQDDNDDKLMKSYLEVRETQLKLSERQ